MVPPQTNRLANGSAPASPDDLFRRLDELAIPTRTFTHPPVFTVDEAKRHRGHIAGVHTKNLFLRNKKEHMWLLVCHQDRDVDLKRLAGQLGSRSRLSFGSPGRLMRYLGVIPGAVNPFAVINDRDGAVAVLLDRDILRGETLNFHPLDNARTVSIHPDDLLRFLEAERHSPRIIDLA